MDDQPAQLAQPGQPVERVERAQPAPPVQPVQPGQPVQPVQTVRTVRTVQTVQTVQPVQLVAQPDQLYQLYHHHPLQPVQPYQPYHQPPVQPVQAFQPAEIVVDHSENGNDAFLVTATLEALIKHAPPFDVFPFFDAADEVFNNHYGVNINVECRGKRWPILRQTLGARSHVLRHMFNVWMIEPFAKSIVFPDEQPEVICAALMFMQTGHYNDQIVTPGQWIPGTRILCDKALNIALITLADRLMIPGLKLAALNRLDHAFVHQWDASEWVDLVMKVYSQNFYKDIRLRGLISLVRDAHYQELVQLWGADHLLVWNLPSIGGPPRRGSIPLMGERPLDG